MSVSSLKIKDVAVGGLATFIALASPYIAVMSAGSLLMLRGALSDLFAVAVALAIPIHLAWQARRMAAEILRQSSQATLDAVVASCSLAQQADCDLYVEAETERYFRGVYNESQIDHSIRRLDQIDLHSMPNAACSTALDRARTSLYVFFAALRHASKEFCDAHCINDGGLRTLHSAYEACALNTDALRKELSRMSSAGINEHNPLSEHA